MITAGQCKQDITPLLTSGVVAFSHKTIGLVSHTVAVMYGQVMKYITLQQHVLHVHQAEWFLTNQWVLSVIGGLSNGSSPVRRRPTIVYTNPGVIVKGDQFQRNLNNTGGNLMKNNEHEELKIEQRNYHDSVTETQYHSRILQYLT